jgi:hypothetical protein
MNLALSALQGLAFEINPTPKTADSKPTIACYISKLPDKTIAALPENVRS